MFEKYDWDKPLGQRRPKVMERMPSPPKSIGFEIDGQKLKQATEQGDRWLEGPLGRVCLGIGYLIFGCVVLALVVGLLILSFIFPGVGLGLLFVIAVPLFAHALDTPGARRR